MTIKLKRSASAILVENLNTAQNHAMHLKPDTEEKKDPIVFDTLPRQWFGKGILHAMRGEKHLQFPLNW